MALKDYLDKAEDVLGNTLGSAADGADRAVKDVVRVRRFSQVAQDLAAAGMVTTHGGNLSETDGSHIWITRTGSQLAHLTNNDIIRTTLDASASDKDCSMELLVHRAIYHAVGAGGSVAGASGVSCAVAHAHCPYTVAASLVYAESDEHLIPVIESEALFSFPAGVPVVSPSETISSQEVADAMAQLAVEGKRIGVVRGHGPFAWAPTLEEAHRLLSVLEHACQVAFIAQMWKR